MVVCEIRQGRDLFPNAFSIHQQIPEFQIDANTYDQLNERMNNVQQLLILVAYVDQRPVGYLIGYERYSAFYIWIAGVLSNHRGTGIFVQLMNRVEQWALEKNYSSLTIKTRNSFKSMLLYLISHNFKFIDIDKRQSIDSHRLLLEKIIRSKE